MYARVSRLQMPLDRVDDGVIIFRTESVPILRSMGGYAGASIAVNSEAGDLHVVSYWESREARQGSEDAATALREYTVEDEEGTIVSVERLDMAVLEAVGDPTGPTHLRVTRADVAEPGDLIAVAASVRDDMLPALRSAAGFRGLMLGINRDERHCVITTAWDTAEDRYATEATESGLRAWVLSSVVEGEPEVTAYDVRTAEFAAAGARAFGGLAGAAGSR